MRRSRRRAVPERAPAAPSFPAATRRDGTVVVRITDAGVDAIIAEATRHGLDCESWSADFLHPRVLEIVARALRATPGWWVNRTPQKA
jgi:hypothetical protein